MANLVGFVAYPSQPTDVAIVIKSAVNELNRYEGIEFVLWEENDISGMPITTPIFQNIEKSDALVADI